MANLREFARPNGVYLLRFLCINVQCWAKKEVPGSSETLTAVKSSCFDNCHRQPGADRQFPHTLASTFLLNSVRKTGGR